MSDSGETHYASWPSRLYSERPIGGRRPLSVAISDVVRRLPTLLAVPPVGVYLGDDEPKRIDMNDDALVAALLNDLRDYGRPFIVANDASSWSFMLSVHEAPHEAIQYLNVGLPGAREPQLARVDAMTAAVRETGMLFDADIAFVEDAALASSYTRDRGVRASIANLPPEAGIDLASLPAWKPVPGVAGALPELRLQSEIDRQRVPAGVYWINWWSAPIVATLGPERIRSADWAHMEAFADGSMVLVASEAPPDLADPADIDRLASIVEHLDLRARQDEHLSARALP